MEVEFDPTKDETNRRQHGLSLADAALLKFGSVQPDNRKDYGEPRYRAFGWIGDRLHMLAFTIRDGRVRAISLRRANKQEVKRHGQ